MPDQWSRKTSEFQDRWIPEETEESESNTQRYYFIPTLRKKKKEVSVGKDVEKLEPSCTAGRKAKWCSLCGGSSKS